MVGRHSAEWGEDVVAFVVRACEAGPDAAALDALAAKHDAVAEMRGRLAVAVDEAYASAATVLAPGCTIALIPPVSGG